MKSPAQNANCFVASPDWLQIEELAVLAGLIPVSNVNCAFAT